MEIFLVMLTVVGVAGYLSRNLLTRKKVIRRMSVDHARHVAAGNASRVPVTGKCSCGKAKCPYKGRQHPKENLLTIHRGVRRQFGSNSTTKRGG